MSERWLRRVQAKRLRERAIRYAVNGWPVAPLAVPHGHCVDPHLVGEVARTGPQAEAAWSEYGWDIALMTERFEVMELPPEYGALLNHALKTSCPTAMAPTHRRWWFFLEPWSIDDELVIAAGGVLHREWVPAPGTRLESTGRIRWLVHPYQTRWQPYRRRDPVGSVLGQLL